MVPWRSAAAWFTVQWHAHEMLDFTPLLPPPCWYDSNAPATTSTTLPARVGLLGRVERIAVHELVVEPLVAEIARLVRDPFLQAAVRLDDELGHAVFLDVDAIGVEPDRSPGEHPSQRMGGRAPANPAGATLNRHAEVLGRRPSLEARRQSY